MTALHCTDGVDVPLLSKGQMKQLARLRRFVATGLLNCGVLVSEEVRARGHGWLRLELSCWIMRYKCCTLIGLVLYFAVVSAVLTVFTPLRSGRGTGRHMQVLRIELGGSLDLELVKWLWTIARG